MRTTNARWHEANSARELRVEVDLLIFKLETIVGTQLIFVHQLILTQIQRNLDRFNGNSY